ncbi:MAG: nucleotidyltransferase [Candidatus Eremiobacteraeota bacterium]|nr:nucleotidyltransferase [Candidatus Eremiobacteraeota bacterium]
MGIANSQLEIWSHQGAITQSKDTYATIRLALESSDTNYANKSFEVFLQGSYGNDTNVRTESDVDVVICTDYIYYSDLSSLTLPERATFNAAFIPAIYTYANFKTDVVSALEKRFGSAYVKVDNKAVKIKPYGDRRSADVIVATEYRRYTSYPAYIRGICLFTRSGEQIVDYPKQHSANCTSKHQATNEWFKPMIRIIKNIRNRLVSSGAIKDGTAPSYFLEGLLYNVPKEKFETSYLNTFISAINWLYTANRNSFVCANEQHSLFGESGSSSWSADDCSLFLQKIVKFWDDW